MPNNVIKKIGIKNPSNNDIVYHDIGADAANITVDEDTNLDEKLTELTNPATTSSAGMMSADDKIKLNGIADNANNYSADLVISNSANGTTDVSSITQNNVHLNYVSNNSVINSHPIIGADDITVTGSGKTIIIRGTDTVSDLIVGSSSTEDEYDEEATNGNVYLNLCNNKNGIHSHNIVGQNGIEVTSSGQGEISISNAFVEEKTNQFLVYKSSSEHLTNNIIFNSIPTYEYGGEQDNYLYISGNVISIFGRPVIFKCYEFLQKLTFPFSGSCQSSWKNIFSTSPFYIKIGNEDYLNFKIYDTSSAYSDASVRIYSSNPDSSVYKSRISVDTYLDQVATTFSSAGIIKTDNGTSTFNVKIFGVEIAQYAYVYNYSNYKPEPLFEVYF